MTAKEDERAQRTWDAQQLHRLAVDYRVEGEFMDRARATGDGTLVELVAMLGSGAAGKAGARRDAVILLLQERIAERLSGASDRLTQAGNRLACVGVVVMVAQLILAFVVFWRSR